MGGMMIQSVNISTNGDVVIYRTRGTRMIVHVYNDVTSSSLSRVRTWLHIYPYLFGESGEYVGYVVHNPRGITWYHE